MITNGQKWHYFAVKRLNALLKRKQDHNGYYYCLNCFEPFRTKSKLKSHKKEYQSLS